MRGTFSVVVVLFLLLSPLDQAAAIPIESPEQAFELVTEEVCQGKTKDLGMFVSKQPLSKGTVIENWHGPFLTLDSEKWFVLIDDAPGANWEHPCRYVFIDPKTGQFEVKETTSPPTIWQNMKRFLGPDPFGGENRKEELREVRSMKSRSAWTSPA